MVPDKEDNTSKHEIQSLVKYTAIICEYFDRFLVSDIKGSVMNSLHQTSRRRITEGGLLVERYPSCFPHTHTCTGRDTPRPHTPGHSLAFPHQGQASAAHAITAATAAADGTARSPRGAAN